MWTADESSVFTLCLVSARGASLSDLGISEGQKAINGGYFDADFNVVGYCKLNGVVVNDVHSNKLSGYVGIDAAGTVTMEMGRPDSLDQCQSVFQAGPYVIDPGGKFGIRSETKIKADRFLLGLKENGQLDGIFIKAVSLFEAATYLQDKGYDRVLNIDGGPTGFYWASADNYQFIRAPKMILKFE